VAVPYGVLTAILPEVPIDGTDVEIDVAVALETTAGVPLKLTRFLLAVVWKLVPVIVTAVPGLLALPVVGWKVEMLGVSQAEVTVKLLALVTVPFGLVTVTRPVVAVLGTVTVKDVAVADTIVALTPPIVTVSLDSVVEKPLP